MQDVARRPALCSALEALISCVKLYVRPFLRWMRFALNVSSFQEGLLGRSRNFFFFAFSETVMCVVLYCSSVLDTLPLFERLRGILFEYGVVRAGTLHGWCLCCRRQSM